MSIIYVCIIYSTYVTPLTLSSARSAAALSPSPVIVIVPLTSMYESA